MLRGKFIVFVLLGLLSFHTLGAYPFFSKKKEKKPKKEKQKGMFRDSLDNAFDASKWMTQLHGFLPLPSVITEPAVGYGLMLNMVFFHPTSESINKNDEKTKHLSLPSMTVVGGAYTQNKTWGVYAGHYGSYNHDKIRLGVFGGWMDINMNFYLTGPLGNENKLLFNMSGLPIYLSFAHKLGKSHWYMGPDYFFYTSQIKLETDLDIPMFDSLVGETQLGGLGLNIYRQNFDNGFTPNRGTKVKLTYRYNDDWLGSDYQYGNMKLQFLGFGDWVNNWVMGLRLQADMIHGDYPFYVRPSISLRGIPMMRYQGDYVLTAETEHRVNIFRRWALVGFVGVGVTNNWDEQFSLDQSKFAGGGGFRYLLARWFGMYMGIDVAAGPEGWAWYIIMGSNWLGK